MTMTMECACCGCKYPVYKLASTSWTEPSCENCINLIISELEDALDAIRRETAENESNDFDNENY